MASQPAIGGRRDGFRDALRDIAELCDEGARDQKEARHDRVNPGQAMIHASIDAERLFERLAESARKLRR